MNAKVKGAARQVAQRISRGGVMHCAACRELKALSPKWAVHMYLPDVAGHPATISAICGTCSTDESKREKFQQMVETRSRAIAEDRKP